MNNDRPKDKMEMYKEGTEVQMTYTSKKKRLSKKLQAKFVGPFTIRSTK